MIAGVVKETQPGERRVALVPAVVPALAKNGWDVLLEAGAGAGAAYGDRAYTEHGAKMIQAIVRGFVPISGAGISPWGFMNTEISVA